MKIERLFRLLTTFGWAASLVLLVGCGQERAPDMDLIGHQVAIEAVDAVSAGDPALTSDKFTRLQSFDPAWPGLDELLRVTIDDAALRAANEEQDARSALAVLDEARGKYGSSDALDEAAYRLMDIQRIERYARQTWSRSTAARAAFSDLPDPKSLNVESYGAWYATEDATIKRMAEIERKKLVYALVRTIDRSQVSGEFAAADAAVARLKELDATHGVGGGPGPSGLVEAAEFRAFRQLCEGGIAEQDILSPKTLSGRAAVALASAKRGNVIRGLSQWRDLREAFPLVDGRPFAKLVDVSKSGLRLSDSPNGASLLQAMFLLANNGGAMVAPKKE